MKPDQISRIVAGTLKRMDIPEPAVAMLIKGTFAIESDLDETSDAGMYGFQMFTEKEVYDLYTEIFAFNRRLVDIVKRGSFVDITNISLEDFKFALQSNIAFMTAVLYVYYSIQYDSVPDNNIDAVARAYKKYFVKEDSVSYEEQFKSIYRRTFLR